VASRHQDAKKPPIFSPLDNADPADDTTATSKTTLRSPLPTIENEQHEVLRIL
jgi:hypothetical protein